MELSKLCRYLKQELVEIDQHSKETEKQLEEQTYRIKEIEDKIRKTEENFDFAYEVFSPISQEYGRTKDQVEAWKDEKKRLERVLGELRKELESDRQKKEELSEILKEVENAEHTNVKKLEKIEKKYSQMLGIEIIERQEQERQRISRDLHDTIVQNLTAMIYKVEFCQQIMDIDPIRVRLELQLLIQTIQESVDDMREIIHNLHPMSFDDIGFQETLLHEIDRLRKNLDMKIDFSVRGEIERVSPAYELTILRIIQEATNNSKKYSDSEKLEIVLSYEKDRIVLSICDRGNGFDIEEIRARQQNSGFGIPMMKERVCLLKGEMEIHSEKNEGTKIVVILPKKELKETDED